MESRMWAIVTMAFCAALWSGPVALAGPITPPPGPVASTYKTLVEVEPRIAINSTNTPGDADSVFKITQAGSYYLTGNVIGVSAKHGIEIATGNVTIDLNSFSVVGLGGADGFDGIRTSISALRYIVIRGGEVRNWSGDGIDLRTSATVRCRAERVWAVDNVGSGIVLDDSSVILDCDAIGNGLSGLAIDSGATIERSRANSNGGDGIVVGGGVVRDCYSGSNGGNGFNVTRISWIESCRAILNQLDGIRVLERCIVRGNVCESNGNGGVGAGIHATGSNNLIEGNRCANGDVGIDVDAPDNMIISNICVSNTTDWTIVANNNHGPIIDRRTVTTSSVSGFSAPSAMGSTDPRANFSY